MIDILKIHQGDLRRPGKRTGSSIGLDRISGSAGLSGRISGIRQEKSRKSGNIGQGLLDDPAAYPAGKPDPAQPYSSIYF